MNVSRAPRVMMVSRLFFPWIGGTERQAQKLAGALVEQGIDVRILTGRWFRGTPAADTVDGVRVIRNHTLWEFFGIRGLRKLGGYLYVVSLSWALWRHRKTYDVIHVHGLNYHTAVSAFCGARLGKPVVAKLANSGPDSDISKMRQSQQLAGSRFLLPSALRCDRYVALNTVIVKELTEAGVDRHRIVEIPNGVAVASQAVDGARSLRELRMVFVGRLHEQKDLFTLIRAVVEIERMQPGTITLTLVGDGPLRSEIDELVKSQGVDHCVRLVGSSSDVESHLMASDVFVLPSRAEGLSNALLEAMASGVPVIASRIPGNVDVVDHERTGLLFEVGDEHALAECILAMVDTSLRDRLARAARAEIAERYGLETIASRYVELYRDLVASIGQAPKEPIQQEEAS